MAKEMVRLDWVLFVVHFICALISLGGFLLALSTASVFMVFFNFVFLLFNVIFAVSRYKDATS